MCRVLLNYRVAQKACTRSHWRHLGNVWPFNRRRTALA